MKARIFVTLIIVLSMCMVCAACNDDGDTDWYLEGFNDGEVDGYTDGLAGTPKSYDGMDCPGDCPSGLKMTYRAGYRNGYDFGYTAGEHDAIIEVPGGPTVPKLKPTYPTTKDEPDNCMHSPLLGLGFKLPDGTITKRGNQLPTLYTWAEVDDRDEHHTTLTHPAEGTYTGCVIITPPQIAGEPLVPFNFWNTSKGLRFLQWRANAG